MGNRKAKEAAPATVIMTAEEFSTDTPAQVNIFGASTSLPAILRDTPPYAAAIWQQAIDILEPRTGRTQPAHTFHDAASGLAYAIWHHGRGAIAVVSGRPEALLPYTDTTENEREALLIDSAQQAAGGCEVLALATTELAKAATASEEVTGAGPLTFAGCITLKRVPSPKALAYARHARTQGLRLLLITRQPLVYAETIGLLNGLIDKSTTGFDAHELLGTPSPAQEAALRSAAVIGNISPRTAPLVARTLSGLTAHLTPPARKLLTQ